MLTGTLNVAEHFGQWCGFSCVCSCKCFCNKHCFLNSWAQTSHLKHGRCFKFIHQKLDFKKRKCSNPPKIIYIFITCLSILFPFLGLLIFLCINFFGITETSFLLLDVFRDNFFCSLFFLVADLFGRLEFLFCVSKWLVEEELLNNWTSWFSISFWKWKHWDFKFKSSTASRVDWIIWQESFVLI